MSKPRLKAGLFLSSFFLNVTSEERDGHHVFYYDISDIEDARKLYSFFKDCAIDFSLQAYRNDGVTILRFLIDDPKSVRIIVEFFDRIQNSGA